MPSWAKPSSGHLSRSEGGSATRSHPPRRRNGAAHSAVTAGGPKLRATTTSTEARNSPRPAVSARWPTTETRRSSPSVLTACRRNSARTSRPSRSSHRVAGHASAKGRPGKPPPLPRSSAVCGGAASTPPISRARSMCGPTGPGPISPRCCPSSRTASSARRCDESSRFGRLAEGPTTSPLGATCKIPETRSARPAPAPFRSVREPLEARSPDDSGPRPPRWWTLRPPP